MWLASEVDSPAGKNITTAGAGVPRTGEDLTYKAPFLHALAAPESGVPALNHYQSLDPALLLAGGEVDSSPGTAARAQEGTAERLSALYLRSMHALSDATGVRLSHLRGI